ncbi:amine oxidase [Scheffersomyces amazonensis]|uniref:amine oxidase n=1 Tax=Scheffersomyces amazonensis TaxID=1078765 RepID=UPI00315D5D2E
MSNADIKIVEVAIVGAGVAGLKAAQTILCDSRSKVKAKDVLVLEAQNRVGGRILTDRTSSKFAYNYDLGAAWFHDSLTNVVLKEATKLDNFNREQDTYYDDKDAKVYSQDGPVDLVETKINRVYDDLEKFIELYFYNDIEVEDMSLKEITNKYLDEYRNILTDEQQKYCRLLVRHYESWYGISWDIISAKYVLMDHHGRDLLNKNGYDFIIDKLKSDIPNESILLNAQVKVIDRSNKAHSRKILLELSSGIKVYCNYVVVTVPQSILQLPQSDPYGITWEPALPSNFQEALSSIHFGSLGKVIFEFDSIWWDKNEDRFTVLASETQDKPASEPITSHPKPFDYHTFIVNFASVHKENILRGSGLVILTQSPLTEYLESHSKEDAWRYYKPILEKLVVPGSTISNPINTIITDWTQNPYIRGSYAALHTHDDPSSLVIQLSGEIDNTGIVGHPNIRFAGEHAISDGAGCVHGAYSSGQREGEWVIQDMN